MKGINLRSWLPEFFFFSLHFTALSHLVGKSVNEIRLWIIMSQTHMSFSLFKCDFKITERSSDYWMGATSHIFTIIIYHLPILFEIMTILSIEPMKLLTPQNMESIFRSPQNLFVITSHCVVLWVYFLPHQSLPSSFKPSSIL